jgi:hypothetical protein
MAAEAVLLWGWKEAQTEMMRCLRDYPGSAEANMTILLLHWTPEDGDMEIADGEGRRRRWVE